MPVDASIYGDIQTPKLDPLGMATQYAGMQNALNQNRLFQQEFKARSAIGPLYQQAIDPQTGRLDSNKLLASAAGNPDTAFMAGDLAAAAQAREAQQIGIDKAQLELFQARNTAVLDRVTSLLAKRDPTTGQPAPISINDVKFHITGLTLQPIFQSPDAISSLASALASAPTDPGKIREWLGDLYTQAHNNEAGFKTLFGTPAAVDTGGAVQPTMQGGYAGTVATGAPFQKSMTPGEANTPQEMRGPQGQQLFTTRGQLAGQVAAAGGPVQSGPSASQAAYLTGVGGKMADYENDLNVRTNAGSNVVQRFGEMLDALNSFKPGASTEARMKAAQTAQAILTAIPGIGPEKVRGIVNGIAGGDLGAQQEFQKLAVTTSTEALKQALGANRIALMEFTTFQKANPNLTTDPRAIEKMFNFATRVYERDAREQQALQQYKASGQDITGFPAQWQQQMVQEGIIDPKYVRAATSRSSSGGRGGAGASGLGASPANPVAPKSFSEAQKLSPGTWFRRPDGKVVQRK